MVAPNTTKVKDSRCRHAREPFLGPARDGISYNLGIVEGTAYDEGPDERGE
jgi:hypothetical protein